MSDMLTEVKFWAQVMTDAKRTVICSPDLESRVKGWVDARDMGGLITVHVNPCCPEGRILILDEGAIQASRNQAMDRSA